MNTLEIETNSPKIFKDYSPKIKEKLYNTENLNEKSSDINNLIILLNWCFHTKNNFFVPNFNKRLVHPVCFAYNKIKNNILTQNVFYKIEDVFTDIPKENIKTLKFILLRYINIYDSLPDSEPITNNQNINTLWETVTKKSIKNCISYMESYVAGLEKNQ